MTRPRRAAYRIVAGFGVVSLLADVVYESARSVTGPLLAGLGAGAVWVGVVGGLGEGSALLLRLVSGPLADRTRAYWTLATAGYATTAVAVPLLAVTPVLGGVLGLVAASTLLVAERVGKAVRTPARDVLIATAGRRIGAGRAFALHELLDQVGATVGPLLLAGTAAVTGGFQLGLALLAVPGAAALVVLVLLRRAGRAVVDPDLPTTVPASRGRSGWPALSALPAVFRGHLLFALLSTLGIPGFGLLSFHLVDRGLLTPAAVPVGYAVAMVVDAGAAVLTGMFFDRVGRRVLLVLPPLAALVPVFGFTGNIALGLVGVLLWGAVLGVQESTLRAAVATTVPAEVRGTAYGIFGAGLGVAYLLGGLLTGVLYARSVPLLVVVTALLQLAALLVLLTSSAGRAEPAGGGTFSGDGD